MAALVIDPSIALAWLLPDEANSAAQKIRKELESGAKSWIPSHWWLELTNGLLMAERRGRIAGPQLDQAMALVGALPMQEDDRTAAQIPTRTLVFARKHKLTIYDAAYLELAKRRGAVLATLDDALASAARKEEIAVAKT